MTAVLIPIKIRTAPTRIFSIRMTDEGRKVPVSVPANAVSDMNTRVDSIAPKPK